MGPGGGQSFVQWTVYPLLHSHRQPMHSTGSSNWLQVVHMKEWKASKSSRLGLQSQPSSAVHSSPGADGGPPHLNSPGEQSTCRTNPEGQRTRLGVTSTLETTMPVAMPTAISTTENAMAMPAVTSWPMKASMLR